MSSVIEQTIKSLVEFEAELERAKSDASDRKKRTLKDASDWAATAKSSAIARAQKIASDRLAQARSEAEEEAAVIAKKGEESLRAFEASISKHKQKAADHVVSRLLGGPS